MLRIPTHPPPPQLYIHTRTHWSDLLHQYREMPTVRARPHTPTHPPVFCWLQTLLWPHRPAATRGTRTTQQPLQTFPCSWNIQGWTSRHSREAPGDATRRYEDRIKWRKTAATNTAIAPGVAIRHTIALASLACTQATHSRGSRAVVMAALGTAGRDLSGVIPTAECCEMRCRSEKAWEWLASGGAPGRSDRSK